MVTATVEREELQQLIQVLPDEKIPEVLLFVKDVCDEEYEPNEETIAALREAEIISRDPNVKAYTDIEEMMKDILADV